MAIQLEMINFIVPIETIKEKYPGGWEQCLQDHENLLGNRIYYDNYLFRDGAMNSMDISFLIEQWKELGFHTHIGGKRPVKWVDVCVVEAMSGGATLPCDWLEVDGDIAYLKNKAKGRIVNSNNFGDLAGR